MVITLWDALDAGGMVRGGGRCWRRPWLLPPRAAHSPGSCRKPPETPWSHSKSLFFWEPGKGERWSNRLGRETPKSSPAASPRSLSAPAPCPWGSPLQTPHSAVSKSPSRGSAKGLIQAPLVSRGCRRVPEPVAPWQGRAGHRWLPCGTLQRGCPHAPSPSCSSDPSRRLHEAGGSHSRSLFLAGVRWRRGSEGPHDCQGCGCQEEPPEAWGVPGDTPAWGCRRGGSQGQMGGHGGAQPGATLPGHCGGSQLTCAEDARLALASLLCQRNQLCLRGCRTLRTAPLLAPTHPCRAVLHGATPFRAVPCLAAEGPHCKPRGRAAGGRAKMRA